MNISVEEKDIVKAILQHTENGTTDMQPELMRNPVTTYTDRRRVRQGQDVLVSLSQMDL